MSRRCFEGPDTATVLARVNDELGPTARVVSAAKVRSGGIGGFFVREHVEVVVEVPDDLPPDSSDADTAQGPLLSPAASVLDLVEARNNAERRADASTFGAPTEASDFAAALTRACRTESLDEALPPEVLPPETLTPEAPATGGPAVEAAPPPSSPRPASPAAEAAERAAEFSSPLSYREVPTGPGVTVAVVDLTGAASAAAEAVAAQVGVPAGDVILAAPDATTRRVPWLAVESPQEAGTRRRAWYRRALPTVVAIDGPALGDAGRVAWTREVLAALEPTLVIAAVDARHKPEDMAVRITDLGGVDALAVEHLGDTRRADTVSLLEVPIAAIDGAPASPQRWAAATRAAVS